MPQVKIQKIKSLTQSVHNIYAYFEFFLRIYMLKYSIWHLPYRQKCYLKFVALIKK